MDEKKSKDIDCLAFLTDDSSISIIKKLLLNFGLSTEGVFLGTVEYAKHYLTSVQMPKLLIIDLSGRDVPLKDLSEISSYCDPSVSIVVVSDQNDVNFCRDVMSLGVNDYILKPLHIIPVEEVFLRTFKPNEFSKSRQLFKNGIMVGVVGSKGGVGTSTVVLNAGVILAKYRKKKTLIIDSNFYTGNINTLLDINKDNSYIDVLTQTKDEIDDYIFESMQTKTQYEKLMLMSGISDFNNNLDISTEQFNMLFEEAKNNFNYTLLDINPNNDKFYSAAVSKLDMVFIVSELTIQSAINTSRIIQYHKDKKLNTIITVILNNIGINSRGAIQQKVFEKVVGMPVQHLISFEPNIVRTAENSGHPIAEYKTGSIYKSIENVVKDICHEGVNNIFKVKQKSSFNRFFRRFFQK